MADSDVRKHCPWDVSEPIEVRFAGVYEVTVDITAEDCSPEDHPVLLSTGWSSRCAL